MRTAAFAILAAALAATAGCGPERGAGGDGAAAAPRVGEVWEDPHGNVCETLRPGFARCRTPDGHIWFREDVPTTGSLIRDPVKGLMWLFSRGKSRGGDEAEGAPGPGGE